MCWRWSTSFLFRQMATTSIRNSPFLATSWDMWTEARLLAFKGFTGLLCMITLKLSEVQCFFKPHQGQGTKKSWLIWVKAGKKNTKPVEVSQYQWSTMSTIKWSTSNYHKRWRTTISQTSIASNNRKWLSSFSSMPRTAMSTSRVTWSTNTRRR